MFDRKIQWMQISQRQRMSPFPNYMSMESVCREMRQVIGYAYKQVVLIFENNVFYVYMSKQDHTKVGKGVLKKVLAQPDMFVKLAKKQKQFARSFYKFLKSNNKPGVLKKISSAELASLHEEYEKRYKQVYSTYFPILSVEIYLFELLRDYIFSTEKNRKKAAKYLDRLITETKAMVNTQEMTAALQLCIRIQKNKKWRSYFRFTNSKRIIEQVKKDKALTKFIKSHERKFFWITRDYEDPVLGFEDFVTRFKNYLQIGPVTALNKILHEEKKLDNDIKSICRKLQIDKEHQRLFQTMREGIYYKELRKWIVSQTLYYYDPILQEIARRGFLTMRQARCLLTHEVRPMLLKKIDTTHELNERIKLSVYHTMRGKSTVYTGNKAKEYYDYFVKVDKKATVFNGMPVSPGQARGPVKIVINPNAFHKVKQGDIICTLQATPVFTPVLIKAAGLICDGGPGITSHPATLAREAGIPGIIGLRMTTKVLKDGQRVFVDGDKGVVKILK